MLKLYYFFIYRRPMVLKLPYGVVFIFNHGTNFVVQIKT